MKTPLWKNKDRIQPLSVSSAAKKIKELAEAAASASCPRLDEKPSATRLMGIQEAGEDGRLYFLIHRDSNKNRQLNNPLNAAYLFQ